MHGVHPHLQLTTIATCRDQMLRTGDGRVAARDSTLQIYVAAPRTSRSHNRPIVNALNAGGGFAYSITDSVDVFGSFSREVAGRNGHVLNRGITVGASWIFSRRFNGYGSTAGGVAPASEYAKLTGKRQRSLARCICQKSGS
jgi:hypothetical protein